MRQRTALIVIAIVAPAVFTSCRAAHIPESMVSDVFSGRAGVLVLIDCTDGKVATFGSDAGTDRLVPCSTFKIWNTLIGLESGIIKSPDEPFYKWDGVERPIPTWNKDLTLKEAFQASCVPAFQNLARRIGPGHMQHWVDSIGYGDRDISSGIDDFWLSANGRKTILISPLEQAELMAKLLGGELPFSNTSLSVLKDLMFVKRTERGSLYGKTGSGTNGRGVYVLGWFVGYVVSQGRTCVFACTARGEDIMGKDARAIVEMVFEKQRLL